MSPEARLRSVVSRDPDGNVRVHFPSKRMTVNLGVIPNDEIDAAVQAAASLLGPREVSEWDAEQEAKRAADAGEPSVEDTVAGWFEQGLGGPAAQR